MKILTVLFSTDAVVSWADAGFEILIALAIKLTVLISVDVLILFMYLTKF
jgi:hypothetical protein